MFLVVPVVILFREKSMKNMMYLINNLEIYVQYEMVLYIFVACFNGFLVMGAEVVFIFVNKSFGNSEAHSLFVPLGSL